METSASAPSQPSTTVKDTVAKRGRPPSKSDPNQCTRPGCNNPRSNPESTNPWCAGCWAVYLSGYRSGALERAREQGFRRGVIALKQGLALQFRSFGSAMFSGAEVASMIASVPTSELEEKGAAV